MSDPRAGEDHGTRITALREWKMHTVLLLHKNIPEANRSVEDETSREQSQNPYSRLFFHIFDEPHSFLAPLNVKDLGCLSVPYYEMKDKVKGEFI
jgi:hypothetical protein